MFPERSVKRPTGDLQTRFPIAGIALLAVLMSAGAAAGVNTNNGNFFISYTDLITNQGFKLQRTYNSLASYKVGLFGYGWGSDLDTYLSVSPAGRPVIRQHGTGSTQHYDPVGESGLDPDTLERSLSLMRNAIAEDLAAGRITNQDSALADLESRAGRHARWQALVASGRVEPIDVPIGTNFTFACSCSYGDWTLKRTVDGYISRNSDGEQQFSANGLLVRLVTPKYEVELERDDSGKLVALVQGDHRVGLFYDDQGLVTSAVDPIRDFISRYQYRHRRLVFQESPKYRVAYRYNDQNRLTRVMYTDRDPLTISYSEEGRVAGLNHPDGREVRYQYGFLDEGDAYFTQATTVLPGASSGKVERLEFYNEKSSAGTRPTRRVHAADGITTTVHFDDIGKPARVVKEARSGTRSDTQITLDTQGRIEKLRSGLWERDLQYRDPSGKALVTQVTRLGAEQSMYKFSYDEQQRLITVEHGGRQVHLEYTGSESLEVARFQTTEGSLLLHRDAEGNLQALELEGVATLEVADGGGVPAMQDAEVVRQSLRVAGAFSGVMRLVNRANAALEIQ